MCLDAEAARKREARKKKTALTENTTQQAESLLALGTKSPLNGRQRDIEEQESEVEEIPAPKRNRQWKVCAYLIYKERGSPSRRTPYRSKLLNTS